MLSFVHLNRDEPAGLTVEFIFRDAEELEEGDAAGQGKLELGLLGHAVERSGHKLLGLILDAQRCRNAAWKTTARSDIMTRVTLL